MDKEPTAAASRRDVSAAVIGSLEEAGYAFCEPPVLQRAADFFDSGEDIRSRLYLTSDLSDAEYCLRPEYTIPICRHYLNTGPAGRPAAYSYCGPVFRYRADGPNEFLQAGLENFGRTDREAADAEILALALEAVARASQPQLVVRFGDAGIFNAFIAALNLSPQLRRRILRGNVQDRALDAILAGASDRNGHDHTGVLAALEGADKQGARALVEDLLAIAGISRVGGRSAAEIAERFLEQAALKSGADFPAEQRDIIAAFLAIETDPDQASVQLHQLATTANLNLDAALDRFDARLGFMAAHDLAVADFVFSARFTRNVDYYTGFVFEAYDRDQPRDKPVIGGGRYDRLLRTLGAQTDIAAVGAAIWVENLDLPALGRTDWWR